MSRSGYWEDWDGDGRPPEFYRRAVENAVNGKRGQAFLTELLAALDALPAPRLIAGQLIEDGEVCALGALAIRRGMDTSNIDVENPDSVADAFKIPRCLAAEIEYENDDDFSANNNVTPEQRFQYMRKWVVSCLASQSQSKVENERLD
jgi:hypothetical protein